MDQGQGQFKTLLGRAVRKAATLATVVMLG